MAGFRSAKMVASMFEPFPRPNKPQLRADLDAWQRGQMGGGDMATSYDDSLKADGIAETIFPDAVRAMLAEHERQATENLHKAIDVAATSTVGNQTVQQKGQKVHG